ncbi:MAG: hypothetical protein ABSH25_04925 [Syntrophorhabdales bacterium]|jgi:hypothetical protein
MKKRVGSVLLAAGLVVVAIGLVTTLVVTKHRKEKDFYVKPTITAEQAISAAKAALPKLAAGKSFVKTGKKGEKKLEVPLVLDGKIVSRVRLNPATGEILPEGQEAPAYEVSASQEQAVKIVQQAIPNLEAASVKLGKHGEWKVDLTLKKAVVAGISVHGGDASILLDGKASRDASRLLPG